MVHVKGPAQLMVCVKLEFSRLGPMRIRHKASRHEEMDKDC